MASNTPKNKGKAAVPQTTGLYKPEYVKDIAESLGISNLSDIVASALASDVEYRIHQVAEEAAKFTRHGRRTTMTTLDIDLALRTLNIEPLYGPSAHNAPSFRRVNPHSSMVASSSGSNASASQPIYFIEDEEIDFDRVLREEKIVLPKPITWRAHWLAVEGVQPLIPENPPAIPREAEAVNGDSGKPAGAVNGTTSLPTPPSPTRHKKQTSQLAKQVLSRELMLYYTRLTSALLPPLPSEQTKRTAALASLRYDAGLQPLLPYLVRWVGEGVVGVLKDGGGDGGDTDGRTLEVLLDVIGALLDNSTLFVEPYLHQLLPPLLSILLHSSLPISHAAHLRTTSAQILSHLLTQHSTTYPSLSPRIMKTLLLALISPGKTRSTREGAVRGLMGVGKEAIRKGLVESGGAKVIGSECMEEEESAIVAAVMDALKILQPPSHQPTPLSSDIPEDTAFRQKLYDTVGEFFAQKLEGDKEWALGVMPAADHPAVAS